MTRPLICRQASLDKRGLTLDGVTLPWAVGLDVDVEDLTGDGKIFGLTVTFIADRVIVEGPDASIDTTRDVAREEAIRLVREGLHDVLVWLGEEL